MRSRAFSIILEGTRIIMRINKNINIKGLELQGDY